MCVCQSLWRQSCLPWKTPAMQESTTQCAACCLAHKHSVLKSASRSPAANIGHERMHLKSLPLGRLPARCYIPDSARHPQSAWDQYIAHAMVCIALQATAALPGSHPAWIAFRPHLGLSKRLPPCQPQLWAATPSCGNCGRRSLPRRGRGRRLRQKLLWKLLLRRQLLRRCAHNCQCQTYVFSVETSNRVQV